MTEFKNILIGNLEKKNFNFIFILFLIIASIGVWWLQSKGLASGSLYLSLLTMGAVLIFYIFTFFIESSSEYSFVMPINRSNFRAVFMFFLGFLAMLAVLFVPQFFGANIVSTEVLSPLASFGLTGETTFQALKISGDPFWTFFIIGWVAPVIEEWVLCVTFVLLGILLAYAIRKSLSLDYGAGNKRFDLSVGFVFSIIMFVVLHSFNNTYVNNPILFVWAGVFRLVLNMLVYGFFFFGSTNAFLGLMFGVGVHMANNWVSMGWSAIQSALLSGSGLIIVSVFVMLLVFLVLKWKNINSMHKTRVV